MMVVGWLVLGWWWVVGGVVVMVTMLVMLVGCRITTLVITTHILSLGLSCWWATCHDLVGLRSAAGACSQYSSISNMSIPLQLPCATMSFNYEQHLGSSESRASPIPKDCHNFSPFQ
jgi:hypothetical protein